MKEALDRVIFGFHCVDVADDEVVFLHETWKRVRLLRPETSETSETFPPARKGRDFYDHTHLLGLNLQERSAVPAIKG